MATEENLQRGAGDEIPENGAARSDGADAPRRRFLGAISRAFMAAGLIGGYGAFAGITGRYLYPARPTDKIWQYVAEVAKLPIGASMAYRAPTGEHVSIVRRAADDFIALSSTCPHLGCQVHWEPQNERYFCPCHNGAFDPSGAATAGPPAEANQALPRYPLRVERGLLYIEVPAVRLVQRGAAHPRQTADITASAPDHRRSAPDQRRVASDKRRVASDKRRVASDQRRGAPGRSRGHKG